jgi:hypothetical protein
VSVTSSEWLERLDQIGFEFVDGFCGYQSAIERLMTFCGLSLIEAVDHLDGFIPKDARRSRPQNGMVRGEVGERHVW